MAGTTLKNGFIFFMNPLSMNPRTIFFMQISKMRYFIHILVIYVLAGIIRNDFTFVDFIDVQTPANHSQTE